VGERRHNPKHRHKALVDVHPSNHVVKLDRVSLDALRVNEMKRLKATLPDAQYRQA